MSRRPILTTTTSAMANTTRSPSRFRWSTTLSRRLRRPRTTDPAIAEEIGRRSPMRSRSSTAVPLRRQHADVQARPAPWYRTKRGLIVLIAVIAVAAVLAIVPMLLRSPGPATEEPTNVTPTTGPAPSSAPPSDRQRCAHTDERSRHRHRPPTAATASPSAQDSTGLFPQYQPPRGGSAAEAREPEIDVTRAPISVAPEPVTPPPNGGSRR